MPTRRGLCVVCKQNKRAIPSETGALVCFQCRKKYGVEISPGIVAKYANTKKAGK